MIKILDYKKHILIWGLVILSVAYVVHLKEQIASLKNTQLIGTYESEYIIPTDITYIAFSKDGNYHISTSSGGILTTGAFSKQDNGIIDFNGGNTTFSPRFIKNVGFEKHLNVNIKSYLSEG